jgi:hypothetical protein
MPSKEAHAKQPSPLSIAYKAFKSENLVYQMNESAKLKIV